MKKTGYLITSVIYSIPTILLTVTSYLVYKKEKQKN
jgi:uncharacterized membrane protein